MFVTLRVNCPHPHNEIIVLVWWVTRVGSTVYLPYILKETHFFEKNEYIQKKSNGLKKTMQYIQ